jgi:hypothetical protein
MRNSFGLGLPIQIQMEKYLISQVRRIPVSHSKNLALDILNGSYETIDFEDYLGGLTFLK